MDATQIAIAAKFCGWEEIGSCYYKQTERILNDMQITVAEGIITPYGCESLKAELRKREYIYTIIWNGEYHYLKVDYEHGCVASEQAPTEADALAIAISALER